MRTRTSSKEGCRSGPGDGAHLSLVVQGGQVGVVQRCETTPGAVDQARVNARRLVRTPEDAVRTVRSVWPKACVCSRVLQVWKARRPRRVLSLGEQRMWVWEAWKACGEHRKSAKVAFDNFNQKCQVTRGKCAHVRARKRGVAAGRGGGAPLFLVCVSKVGGWTLLEEHRGDLGQGV